MRAAGNGLTTAAVGMAPPARLPRRFGQSIFLRLRCSASADKMLPAHRCWRRVGVGVCRVRSSPSVVAVIAIGRLGGELLAPGGRPAIRPASFSQPQEGGARGGLGGALCLERRPFQVVHNMPSDVQPYAGVARGEGQHREHSDQHAWHLYT